MKRTCTNYLNEKFGDLESAAQWQSTFSEELDAKISNSANIQSTLISNMNNLNQRLMEFESCIVDREGGIANKIASSNPIVEQSIESLTSKVMENEQGINDVEAYWRRQNMIVAGVPPTKNEDTTKKVLEIFNSMEGVEIDAKEISTSHRLPNKANDIIVRFVWRKTRNSIYKDRKKISRINPTALSFSANPKKIFLSENLTKRNSELFYHARQLKKQGLVMFAWTYNGRVFIRQSKESEAIAIFTMADFDKVL